jgi:hypothetical protein
MLESDTARVPAAETVRGIIGSIVANITSVIRMAPMRRIVIFIMMHSFL